MNIIKTVNDWFWTPTIWLPRDKTWDDLNEHVKFWDVWVYPLSMALIIITLRYYILNRLIYNPFATFCGMREIPIRSLVPNSELETLFKNHKAKPPKEELTKLSKQVGMSSRQIERWLRIKLSQTKISKHTKFTESSWQISYYIIMFSYGLYVLSDKPWMFDLNNCWYDYPNHAVTNDVWWYYMISCSFYWSMVLTHFVDSRKKDFWQMFFHHMVTIVLIVFSWTCNFVRIGTIVLILHDAADIPLHGAKMFIYMKKQEMCDAVFALFAITWLVTRMGIYPFWIVYNTLFEATKIVEIFPVYYIFNSLLVALQLLHIYWTYFVFKMVVMKVIKGEMEDGRSSSSDIEISEHDKSS